MSDYIKREDVIELFEKYISDDDELFKLLVRILINKVPAAEVVEVRHGKWVCGEDVNMQCSICGHDAYTEGDYQQVKTSYCPNCGAKMDLED